MKVNMNKSNGFCIGVDIHCSPSELFIILRALWLMHENKNVTEIERKKAEEMHKTIIELRERKKE